MSWLIVNQLSVIFIVTYVVIVLAKLSCNRVSVSVYCGNGSFQSNWCQPRSEKGGPSVFAPTLALKNPAV